MHVYATWYGLENGADTWQQLGYWIGTEEKITENQSRIMRDFLADIQSLTGHRVRTSDYEPSKVVLELLPAHIQRDLKQYGFAWWRTQNRLPVPMR